MQIKFNLVKRLAQFQMIWFNIWNEFLSGLGSFYLI